jgi:hypothetical protein
MSNNYLSSSRISPEKELKECRDANVPLVSIPQSVIYELTNVTLNGNNNEQDIIHHTLSNQSKLDELTQKLKQYDNDMEHLSSSLNFWLVAANKEYAKYISLYETSLKPIEKHDLSTLFELNISKNVELLLSNEQIKGIENLRDLYKGLGFVDKKYIYELLESQKKIIQRHNKLIEHYAKSIVELNTFKNNTQTELILEQGRAISELKTNPARLLSGDEILRNHWENALMEEEDGMNSACIITPNNPYD